MLPSSPNQARRRIGAGGHSRKPYRLKVKGWKKIFHANGDQKKAGGAILISDKIDFQIKAVKSTKKDTT